MRVESVGLSARSLFLEKASKIPASVNNTDDCESLIVVAIGDHVGVNRPKSIGGYFHVLPDVPFAGHLTQAADCGIEFIANPICRTDVVRGDMTPNLQKVRAGLGLNQQVPHPAL